MPNGESTLAAALNGLAALGTERDRERLLALLDRLDAARLRVLVAGEAKRGKSTLINALLGRDVLPSGVTPLTAVATTVRYSDDPRIEVAFLDGHQEKHPLTALADFVTEVRNPRNKRLVAGVTVYLDAPVLAGGVELVDTPGTGSVFQWDTRAAHEALQTMDAAVFVLTADPPVSASERDLLGRVAELSVTTFAVLNKADHLEEAGLAEASEFTRQVLAEAGHPGTVYPMSARAALRGGDAGFTAFETDFTAYLASRRKADLRASATAQGRRIAGSLLDEVALTRRAAEMRAGEAADRVGRFSARLAEVAVRSRDAIAVVDAESARVDARLAVDLKAELDVLRDSAAELLGLDLAFPDLREASADQAAAKERELARLEAALRDAELALPLRNHAASDCPGSERRIDGVRHRWLPLSPRRLAALEWTRRHRPLVMRASASWISLRSGGSTRVPVAPCWRTLTRRVSSRARTAMPLRYRLARRARQLPHPLAGGRHGYLSDSARRRL